ncbi:DUF4232 domain-containing protein [Streptomyces sp. NPDC046197]|uniref:DUF4232 domain-containing protein n=1 Tax=Streptomyces sp. NPDC046197 TaxID=3154337 RepID=UPI0033FF3B5B
MVAEEVDVDASGHQCRRPWPVAAQFQVEPVSRTPPPAAVHPPPHRRWGTAQLKWTLTRLDEPANRTSRHLAVAQLTATNTVRHTCTFDGYPWVRAFNGKEEDTIASPTTPGAAPRWMLAPGGSVRVNLRYSEARDPMGNCFLPPETSALQALPPHADPRDNAVLVVAGKQVHEALL